MAEPNLAAEAVAGRGVEDKHARHRAVLPVAVPPKLPTEKAANPTRVLGYSKRPTQRLAAGVPSSHPQGSVSVQSGSMPVSRGTALPATPTTWRRVAR